MSEHYTPEFKETLVTFISVESADIDTATGSDTFGHFIVRYANGDTVDYGVVTAYAAAKAAGYAGSEEQWQTELANVMAFVSGQKYDSNGAITDVVEGDAGYKNNAKYYSKVAEGWATGADPEGQPYRNNSAKFWANEAQAALEGLQNMTVGVTTGEAGTQAAVVHTQTDGVDHLEFTIPRGEPFTVFKTYQSIALMNADKANVAEGKFVMITSNIDDPDNSKLYVRGADEFVFVTDLSGATGVQGPIATAACDYSYQNSSNGTTPPTGTWTSSPTPVPGTYLWTKIELTWNNAASTVSTIYTVVYNGVNGNVASVDGILPDGNGNIALGAVYAPVNSPDFTGDISLGRKANTTVGTNSLAVGTDTEASGNSSVAEGYNTIASHAYTHAEGLSTTASGQNGHAEGWQTTASGNASHSEGYGTVANLPNMHASGSWNKPGTSYDTWIEDTSYEVGDKVTRSPYAYECIVANTDSRFTPSHWKQIPGSGDTAFVVGNGSSSSDRSNAFKLDWAGNGEFQGDVVANGNGGANPISMAGLNDSKADKADTILTTTLSRGRKTNSTVGAYSLAFGTSVTASAPNAIAFGSNTSADGDNAMATGMNTVAAGRASRADGFYATANAPYSAAGGYYATANIVRQSVVGSRNVPDTPYPMWVSGTPYVVGDRVSFNVNISTAKYAVSNTEYGIYGYECIEANSDTAFTVSKWKPLPTNGKNLFVVGNGTEDKEIGVGTQRNPVTSNAMTVDIDGNGEFQGDVIANGNGGSNPISLTDIANLLKTQDVSSEVSFSSTDGTISNAYVYRSGNMVHMAFVFTFTQAVNANTYVTIPITYTNNALRPIARTEGGGANNENIALIDILPSPNRITFYTLQNRSVDQNFWLTITYMCAG